MAQNPRLFVRARSFPGEEFSSYWSQGQHAWGALGSASVYTETEVVCFNTTGSLPTGYTPKEGHWDELPDRLKVMDTAEWLMGLADPEEAGDEDRTVI